MAVNEFKFAEAFAEVSLRDKQFRTGINSITSSLMKLKGALDSAARQAQRFLLIGAGALAAFVKVAADAEETANKFDAVFREGAPGVRKWADDLADAVGRQRQELEETLSGFQAFFVGLGFGGKQAEEMSKKIQTLAIDFASFNNLADAEASQRFISALAGSSEVLDRFGINTKQAALNQELLSRGIEGGIFKASEQEKAISRLNIIYRAMGEQGAIGDAIRTQGSMANQFKRLLADVKDLAIQLGQTFMPIAKDLVTWLINIVKASKEWVMENGELIIKLVAFGAIGAATIIIAAKLAGAIVALAGALKIAGAAQAFLLGLSGPQAWTALAVGVTAATVAVMAMGVAYDKVAESAKEATEAAKKVVEEAEKAAAAPLGGAQAAGGAVVGGAGAAGGADDLAQANPELTAAMAKLAAAETKLAAAEKRVEDTRLSNIEERARIGPPAREIVALAEERRREQRLTRLQNELFVLPQPNLSNLTAANRIINRARQAAIDAAQARLDVAAVVPPGREERQEELTRQLEFTRGQAERARRGVLAARGEVGAIAGRGLRGFRPGEFRGGGEPPVGIPVFNEAPAIIEQQRIERENRLRGIKEPIPQVPIFNEAPNIIRQQQELRETMLRGMGQPRPAGRPDRLELQTTAMAGVQALLQQKFAQPTTAETDAARQRDALIAATQDVSTTIEKLNLGLQ
jgi:hypothetical protein